MAFSLAIKDSKMAHVKLLSALALDLKPVSLSSPRLLPDLLPPWFPCGKREKRRDPRFQRRNSLLISPNPSDVVCSERYRKIKWKIIAYNGWSITQQVPSSCNGRCIVQWLVSFDWNTHKHPQTFTWRLRSWGTKSGEAVDLVNMPYPHN